MKGNVDGQERSRSRFVNGDYFYRNRIITNRTKSCPIDYVSNQKAVNRKQSNPASYIRIRLNLIRCDTGTVVVRNVHGKVQESKKLLPKSYPQLTRIRIYIWLVAVVYD